MATAQQERDDAVAGAESRIGQAESRARQAAESARAELDRALQDADRQVAQVREDAARDQTELRAALEAQITAARRPAPGGALRVEVNLHLRVLLLYRDNKLSLVSHVSAGGGYYYCSDGSCGYAITPTKVPLWRLRRAREEDLKIFGRTGAGDSLGAGSTFQPICGAHYLGAWSPRMRVILRTSSLRFPAWPGVGGLPAPLVRTFGPFAAGALA